MLRWLTLWPVTCDSQNGGAPLLYAVHGNHVRCVEILLGEDECYPWSQNINLPAYLQGHCYNFE